MQQKIEVTGQIATLKSAESVKSRGVAEIWLPKAKATIAIT